MTEGEQYLRMYPELRKWINQCVVCQSIGYKPELPAELSTWGGETSAASQNLRKYFNPLAVSDIGVCSICEKFI